MVCLQPLPDRICVQWVLSKPEHHQNNDQASILRRKKEVQERKAKERNAKVQQHMVNAYGSMEPRWYHGEDQNWWKDTPEKIHCKTVILFSQLFRWLFLSTSNIRLPVRIHRQCSSTSIDAALWSFSYRMSLIQCVFSEVSFHQFCSSPWYSRSQIAPIWCLSGVWIIRSP